MSLHLVTMATKKPSTAHNMINSCRQFKWPLIILDINKDWKGWSSRMQTYYDYVSKQPPEDIVIFLDCYDILCLKSPDEFLNTFQTFGKDIVVGAESGYCGPHNCLPLNYYWSKLKNELSVIECSQPIIPNHVNAGFVCGKASSLTNMYQWCINKKFKDDQLALCHFVEHSWKSGKENITLDFQIQIVLNTHDKMKEHQICIDETHRKLKLLLVSDKCSQEIFPFFVHFPGFLFQQTGYPFLSPDHPTSPYKYELIAKSILGNNYIEVYNVDHRMYKHYIRGTWTSFVLLFLFFIAFVIVLSLLLAKK